MILGYDSKSWCFNAQLMLCLTMFCCNFFYQSLDLMNKGVADQLSSGGLMKQPYIIATQFLYGVTIINRAWYTQEIQVSALMFELTKEQLEKDLERDHNMANIMIQLDIFCHRTWCSKCQCYGCRVFNIS